MNFLTDATQRLKTHVNTNPRHLQIALLSIALLVIFFMFFNRVENVIEVIAKEDALTVPDSLHRWAECTYYVIGYNTGVVTISALASSIVYYLGYTYMKTTDEVSFTSLFMDIGHLKAFALEYVCTVALAAILFIASAIVFTIAIAKLVPEFNLSRGVIAANLASTFVLFVTGVTQALGWHKGAYGLVTAIFTPSQKWNGDVLPMKKESFESYSGYLYTLTGLDFLNDRAEDSYVDAFKGMFFPVFHSMNYLIKDFAGFTLKEDGCGAYVAWTALWAAWLLNLALLVIIPRGSFLKFRGYGQKHPDGYCSKVINFLHFRGNVKHGNLGRLTSVWGWLSFMYPDLCRRPPPPPPAGDDDA